MKKVLSFAVISLLVLVLAACGGGEKGIEEGKLVIGASNVPHAEILEEAKPLLEEQGIELDIQTYTDYIIPNQALRDKDIDANFFQHEPYLKSQIEENDYEFVSAGGVHIEPIGVYSQEYDSLEELPEGAEILMSNSVADHGRILAMLEEKGLITLKEGVEVTSASVDDIEENPKNLEFNTQFEAAFLPQAYLNGDGDAVLINGNYALGADIDPEKEAIALESGENNPYVNLIVVREEDKDNEQIKALVEVLQSDEIKAFIEEEYKGSVLPAKASDEE
ncbi:MetQ/NlpA family ABC transporter substrate-binding protein [Sutcliffiella horikoshii]|uniref:Lipoprotein n=1 Tax=Sutcliffiella horikoshii TaxID=79883 RepID=A0A5D4SCV3_9BACI|nr:MetQ/NlpA family ABC transporter substrate-binding protein [Sutcliffiella horikoshii]TYS60158.1 MetQ/NlpA family ABC transporter substrate-binding protein [Sutcliffiella horikoshii]TYS72214.1 MetQ/NlpA family ABC transporter substrate-binding protein [Sutcliffiella horikoshii]